jgi:hypothetical protein
MLNIQEKDEGYIPIAPGPIDNNRGRKRTNEVQSSRIKVYFIKTKSDTRKNQTISLKINKV